MQRQYTGAAGRIENFQVAVYLTYTSRHGHAAIDCALYLPRSWTEDQIRCERAAVPDDVGFATKPQLARQMIERAMECERSAWDSCSAGVAHRCGGDNGWCVGWQV